MRFLLINNKPLNPSGPLDYSMKLPIPLGLIPNYFCNFSSSIIMLLQVMASLDDRRQDTLIVAIQLFLSAPFGRSICHVAP